MKRALILFLAIVTLPAALAADPSGTLTGKAADAQDAAGVPFVPPEGTDEASKQAYADFQTQAKAEPLAMKLADSVGQNRIAINLSWVLICGFLVMFMQAGFALVETGLCRAKNASHTMLMNFMIYPIGLTGFWICGFAFMFGSMPVGSIGGTPGLSPEFEYSVEIFGKTFGLIAHNAFFLGGTSYDVGIFAIFLFQMVFMDTAATIPTGAMAERWNLKSFYVFGFFMSMILYPIFGNWAWGGGWLSQLGVNFGLGHGYVDFAGSGVVHALGGFCALAGAMVLGPRLGKYNADGSVNPIPAHHVPMALLGAFILAFGWFGFNPGSTLGLSGGGLSRAAIVAVVTMLAGAGGALSASLFLMLRTHRPDPTMVANGMLAGLVAITAPSGFVSAPVGFLIGVIAGFLVCFSVDILDRFKIDDPVGAISVHGVGGTFGVICVGIFADGTAVFGGSWNGVAGGVTGILYGDTGQLWAQLIGVGTLIVWAFGLSYVFFWVLNKIMGLRVSEQAELDGLDIPETGIMGYPSFPSTD